MIYLIGVLVFSFIGGIFFTDNMRIRHFLCFLFCGAIVVFCAVKMVDIIHGYEQCQQQIEQKK